MFALISSRSGSQSAMLLRWALQGHHGPLVQLLGQVWYEGIVSKYGNCPKNLLPNFLIKWHMQLVQTQVRKEQSDQGLHYLPFH